MLQVCNCLLGEDGKKHLPALLCLGIFQEHKRSCGDTRGSVEAGILVPSLAAVINVMKCGWISEMELDAESSRQ
jgi:hypothetical protein